VGSSLNLDLNLNQNLNLNSKRREGGIFFGREEEEELKSC
jgi:hypothetical protein